MKALLMGGQACVLYGAAEFSRDTDFAILSESSNLKALRAALDELNAEVIALPPFEAQFLERGHAIHFRCGRADVSGLRIDVMSKMRGVDEFVKLWDRRTTFQFPESSYDVLALPDLVQAKKTQRDKDWPMIRRLVDRDYFQNRDQASPAKLDFWLRELRTTELLVEIARSPLIDLSEVLAGRPFLAAARRGDIAAVEAGLDLEEKHERAADREYWKPLREELAALRRARLK